MTYFSNTHILTPWHGQKHYCPPSRFFWRVIKNKLIISTRSRYREKKEPKTLIINRVEVRSEQVWKKKKMTNKQGKRSFNKTEEVMRCCVLPDLWSQRMKEQIATLKRFSTNRVTRDPVHLSACWTGGSSEWETPGCRESVNSGERNQDKLWWLRNVGRWEQQRKWRRFGWDFEMLFLCFSTCTPEGVYCQDIDCRGLSLNVS